MLFTTLQGWQARELLDADIPALQQLFEARNSCASAGRSSTA